MSVPEREVTTARDLLDRYVRGDRDFEAAKLSEADLHNAILRGANLSEALLSEALLTRTDLRGADLSWADLSAANLGGADLRGAILTRADLSGADLRHANLLRADLSLAQLGGARLGGAIAPDGSVYPEAEREDAVTDEVAVLRQALGEARERVAALEAQLKALGVSTELNEEADESC
ncbi:MAG: pentapeptide repeat-containing protein [Geitlerinemataceae cyanobacterium]